jgi:23S rRNA (guanine745-N1)-methyltransferase
MILACTVRGCGAPLTRLEREYACARGHHFDTARSGYVNLLQPQDKRSLEPGDTREAVEARRALLDEGFGSALTEKLVEVVEHAGIAPGSSVADLGCGEGTHLAAVVEQFGLDGCGVDISVHAAEAAARRHSAITWVVANADRTLPFADACLALVMSVDGRRNADEIARVLTPTGSFVIAVAAEDDLVELREAVLGAAHAPDRSAGVIAEMGARFELVERTLARETRSFDALGLSRLAASTYRCGRERERAKLAELERLDVTTSHHVLHFRRGPR